MTTLPEDVPLFLPDTDDLQRVREILADAVCSVHEVEFPFVRTDLLWRMELIGADFGWVLWDQRIDEFGIWSKVVFRR